MPELYKMAFFVPFSTVGNGLWEKGKSGNGVLEALEVNGDLGLWVFGFRALELEMLGEVGKWR